MNGWRLYRMMLFIASIGASSAVLAQSGLDAARELAGAGRYDEALRSLEALPEVQATDPQARFLHGVLLAELGRSADAIEVFDALTVDYPRLAEPFNNLAVLYAADGRYEEARDALLVAIQNNPSYATAHENLGDIYAKMAGLSYVRAGELDSANDSARDKGTRVAALFDEDDAPVRTQPARPAEPIRRTPAAAPPPAAAPTPAPAPARAASRLSGPAAERRDEAIALVQSWASAWSAQDADRYLSHYAASFAPSDGGARDAWERVRRDRLARPGFIDVTVSDVEVELGAGDGAWVTFEQGYQSDTYQDRVRKRIDLVMTDEGWKIVGERTLP